MKQQLFSPSPYLPAVTGAKNTYVIGNSNFARTNLIEGGTNEKEERHKGIAC
jgi:hypothetical protein